MVVLAQTPTVHAEPWIIIIGCLCAMSCALLGNFLVLRRMSMMGDAISHAVLPGLAGAFILTQSRASLTMFLGAAIVGVLTALFVQWVHSFGRVDRGAAMGVVFTGLFALGLILIEQAQHNVDIDAECVLYGAIEWTIYDKIYFAAPVIRATGLGWGTWAVPQAALILSGVLAMNLLFVALFYKELKISSFDPALATTLGINASLMHYLLMTMVAITTVAAFESIGSIIVIAMLIVPAAAAHLLTDRLGVMILISLLIAAASAALGHYGAITLPAYLGIEGVADTTNSGMMAAAVGTLFILAMIFAPRHGLLSKALHKWRIERPDQADPPAPAPAASTSN